MSRAVVKPGVLIALCMAACTAAPSAREAPARPMPVVSVDAGTQPEIPVTADGGTLPLIGRVTRIAVSGGDVLITVGIGAEQGINPGWRATLLRRDSDKPLPGGELTIVRVTPRTTVGKLSAQLEDLGDNLRVRLDSE